MERCAAVALLLLVTVVEAQPRLKKEGLEPLKEVKELQFHSDKRTATEPPLPQLVCTGECPHSLISEVLCSNLGVNDTGTVIWKCLFHVTGGNGIRQPTLSCKGKMHSNKQYFSPGTCRMTYEGTKEAKKSAFRRFIGYLTDLMKAFLNNMYVLWSVFGHSFPQYTYNQDGNGVYEVAEYVLTTLE